MAIPSTPIIELPLLLELERHGGRVQKRFDFPAFYESTAKHFPELTSDDRKLLLQDGRTRVFDNAVDWARNSLREKGELNGGLSGVWEITPEGRHRLRTGLTKLGVAAPDGFIRSARSIAEEAGPRWKPKPRRPRRDGPPTPEPDAGEVPPQGQGPVTSATPVLLPSPVPVPTQTPSAHAPTIEEELLDRLRSLAPTQFEFLIAEFLRAKGLSDVSVTGQSGDGGIDGEGNIPFLKLRCCFQAKRYAEGNQVGPPAIRNFKGGVVGRYERGIFITTSSFTAGAVEEAEQPGVTIILIDGRELVARLLELELGVKTVPIVQRSVDDEFFHSLNR